MAFVGNNRGPRKSEIVSKLGPTYFGISPEELETEIQLYREDEARGEVDPVYKDNSERYYIIFNAPHGKTQRFYLEENGYHIEVPVNIQIIEERQAVKNEKVTSAIETTRTKVAEFLDKALQEDRIDQQLYEEAKRYTLPNIENWLMDPYIDTILPKLKEGIYNTIFEKETNANDAVEKWTSIVNAFRQNVRFGTGGIRGMMAFKKESIIRLKNEGIDAPILKGTNTINDFVFLLTSVGVAMFGKEQPEPFQKIVIGYDSRICGHDLAKIVAQLFMAYDYTVYFFDDPCPYPEVTFAIPYEGIKADVGILISASHNDYRYNGYKLSCANGSQFDPEQRDSMYNDYISKAKPKDIKLRPFEEAAEGQLVFLGGEGPLPDYQYYGRDIINIHDAHQKHVEKFLLTENLPQLERQAANPLRIAYCAFHGSGRIAVPRLLKDVGFTNVQIIKHNNLNELDGMFPSFCSEPGHEQQPDPGDPRAADTAVNAFKAEYPGEFDKIDILIGTDPDADRCGVVVKVPENQQHLYGKNYRLLPADDLWALLLWYRLQMDINETTGKVHDADKKFVVLSHTTSDSITRMALRNGLGVIRTWVGFASLSAATRDVWDQKVYEIIDLVQGRNSTYVDLCHPFVCDCLGMDGNRSFNVGAMEQSNGFSILGRPPKDLRSLGKDGHVRDKDGTFAALLLSEVAAWAKRNDYNLIELLDKHVYLDPGIGLFVNLYEPDPLDGEYPGIEGDRLKKNILRRALGYFQLALSGDLKIAGMDVKSACIFRTGKYDAIYPPTHDFVFPDEGVRFYFNEEKTDHVTVRPSGTGNSLRFHIQLHDGSVIESDLIERKQKLHQTGMEIMNDIRKMLKAPRN